MGVCGAAQICRSKDNPQASNMQQKSLSSPKDVGFEYDKRQKQCKAVSDSDSSDIHPPISNNNKSSSRTSDDKTTATATQPTEVTVTVPALSNSRNSRKLNDDTTPSTPRTPSPEPQPQPPPPPKPKPAVIITRKSKSYIPLNDEDTMQPTTTTQPPHPPPTDNTTAFMRQRSAGRQRASSEDIMTAAEHALLEDSRTINKIFVDEYMYNPGLVTPVATPSTNLNPRNVNINTNLSSTAPGKQKQNIGSPAFSINSVHSQSSATDTYNTRHTQEMQNCDNININNIYAVSRAPNLSLSNVGNLLLPGVDPQFPQRISSTSSEWAHLVEQERADRNNGGGGGVFDSEDYIQWRFSRGASVNNGVHNGGNVNSVSSVAIDRVDVSRDQSLTDF